MEGRAVFAFYDGEEDLYARRLCKIVLYNPEQAQLTREWLAARAAERP